MDHMAARALTPIYRIPHAGRKIGVHFSFLSRDDLHLWQQSSHDDPKFCQELENTDMPTLSFIPYFYLSLVASLALCFNHFESRTFMNETAINSLTSSDFFVTSPVTAQDLQQPLQYFRGTSRHAAWSVRCEAAVRVSH